MTRITLFCDARHSFPIRIESIFLKVKAMLVETKTQVEHFLPLAADELFCDFPTKLKKQLDYLKKIKRFGKAKIIFKAGEMPSGFYLLHKGRIRLQWNDSRIIHISDPSAIFGLTEMIADIPYELNAETLTPCVCEYVGREDFIRFLRGEPKFSFRLLRRLALHLQKSRQTLFTSMV